MPNFAGPQPRIRVDNHTGYLCMTDIFRQYQEGKFIFSRWLSEPNTVHFIDAWETFNNPNFNPVEFDGIKVNAGTNTFYVTPAMLLDAGATGLFVQQSRRSLVFVHPDWAIHFCN